MRRPLATVAVVVDTPGGIGQAEGNAAPAEVKVVVRAAGIGAQRRGRNCRSRARLGNDRAGRRRMTGSTDQNTPQRTRAGLPAPLADYADWLLLGTGLDAADALQIASGHRDPLAELNGLANALQAGRLAEDPA